VELQTVYFPLRRSNTCAAEIPTTFQRRNRHRFTREEGFFLLCSRLASKLTVFQLHQLVVIVSPFGRERKLLLVESGVGIILAWKLLVNVRPAVNAESQCAEQTVSGTWRISTHCPVLKARLHVPTMRRLRINKVHFGRLCLVGEVVEHHYCVDDDEVLIRGSSRTSESQTCCAMVVTDG
jgi:hypothetical protein